MGEFAFLWRGGGHDTNIFVNLQKIGKRMSELQKRIDSITRKAELLTSECSLLRRRHAEALDQIAALEATVASQAKEIELLSTRLEYLNVVSVIEPKAEDRAAARDRLTRLLHDIDLCIADLSDCNER